MTRTPVRSFSEWQERRQRAPASLFRHFANEDHALDLVHDGVMRISSSHAWRAASGPLGDRREGTEERDIAADVPCIALTRTGVELLGHPQASNRVTGMSIHVGSDNRAAYAKHTPWFGVCYSERLWEPWFRQSRNLCCAVRIIEPEAFFEAARAAAEMHFLSLDKLIFFDSAHAPVLYDREAYSEQESLVEGLSYFRKDPTFAVEHEYRQLLLPHVPTVDTVAFFVKSNKLKKLVELVDPDELSCASWPSATP